MISGDWLCSATVTSDAGHVSHIIRGWRHVRTSSFLAVRTPTEKISFPRSINSLQRWSGHTLNSRLQSDSRRRGSGSGPRDQCSRQPDQVWVEFGLRASVQTFVQAWPRLCLPLRRRRKSRPRRYERAMPRQLLLRSHCCRFGSGCAPGSSLLQTPTSLPEDTVGRASTRAHVRPQRGGAIAKRRSSDVPSRRATTRTAGSQAQVPERPSD